MTTRESSKRVKRDNKPVLEDLASALPNVSDISDEQLEFQLTMAEAVMNEEADEIRKIIELDAKVSPLLKEDSDADDSGFDTDDLEELNNEEMTLLPNINKYLDITRQRRNKKLNGEAVERETFEEMKERLSSVNMRSGTIYMSGIPEGFYEEQMFNYFSQFGKVIGVLMPRSKRSATPMGYAFVQFKVPQVALLAAHSMNNYLMHSCIVRAKYLEPENVSALTFAKRKPLKSYHSRSSMIIEKNNEPVPDDKAYDARMKKITAQLNRQKKFADMNIKVPNLVTDDYQKKVDAWKLAMDAMKDENILAA